MFGIPPGSVRLDRDTALYSSELKKYVKTEFGDASPHWLVLEALNHNGKKPSRAGRWLAKWSVALRGVSKRTAKAKIPASPDGERVATGSFLGR
ncbi:MAG: hypothetical protein ACE5HJ_07350 [Thermoplasmata archaeon]